MRPICPIEPVFPTPDFNGANTFTRSTHNEKQTYPHRHDDLGLLLNVVDGVEEVRVAKESFGSSEECGVLNVECQQDAENADYSLLAADFSKSIAERRAGDFIAVSEENAWFLAIIPLINETPKYLTLEFIYNKRHASN